MNTAPKLAAITVPRAKRRWPGYLALRTDAAGNIYINEYRWIRVITPDGIIHTIAGNGAQGFSGDGGPATGASLNSPVDMAADSTGNLYIADQQNNRIRRIDRNGIISTVASMFGPEGVFVDRSGTLYVAYQAEIDTVDAAGGLHRIAGGVFGYSGNGGPALKGELSFPGSMAEGASGDLEFVDYQNSVVRAVTRAGTLQLIAGNRLYRFAGDSGPATAGALNSPDDVVPGSRSELYIADTGNDRVRVVEGGQSLRNGAVRPGVPAVMATAAGNGIDGDRGDGGPAINASLFLGTNPLGPQMAVDGAGSLFVTDFNNNSIRKVTPQGIISTYVAGVQPTGIAVDPSGVLYYSQVSSTVWKLPPGGRSTLVAGAEGNYSYCGDGGPATAACLNLPGALAFDSAGNLFLVDVVNNRIRKVTPGGIISTVAGNGKFGSSRGPFDNLPATSVALPQPYYVAADSAGSIYITVFDTQLILKVGPDGMMSTVAGNGSQGYSGDGGLARQASLSLPGGMSFDALGNLYFADQGNNRIRAILAAPPSLVASPQSMSFTAASGGSPAPPQNLTVASPVPGLSLAATGSAPWLKLSLQTGVTPSLIQVSADPVPLAQALTTPLLNLLLPTQTPSSVPSRSRSR